MTEQEWIDLITKEGYQDVRVCPINTSGEISKPHTHDQHTVHVIIDGQLTMTDEQETVTLHKGDRFEIPAGTTHTVQTPHDGCQLLVGVRT